jgi:hypothetical protein
MAQTPIPEVPFDLPEPVRRYLTHLRNAVISVNDSIAPPEVVTNFTVTPMAGGNLIEFTRSNADFYSIYWSSGFDFDKAEVLVSLGQNSRYEDPIGAGGVTRYYWVAANRRNGLRAITDFVASTSLALGTPITPPAPPPIGGTPFTSPAAGGPTDYGQGSKGGFPEEIQ